MKITCLFLLIFFSAHVLSAQTKILDSSVNWSNGTLTVYVTDSLATSVSVQLGTTFQAHDVFNETSLEVGTDLPLSDTFIIPLANVSSGAYYVYIKVNSPAGIQEMEFQTSN
ncbi:MAG TPA: hypothetical protein VE978_22860 [Chitinophagales bacterium]|nr:hypothetical protein [Chitinophagales bacterium]